MAEPETPANQAPQPPVQAGVVISPSGSVSPPSLPAQPPAPSPQPLIPQPPTQPVVESTPQPPPQQSQPKPQFQPEEVPEPVFAQNPGQNYVDRPQFEQQEPITWTASEFVAHHKSAGWYGLLALAAIAVAVIIYLLTKDVISASVVIVGAVFLGGYGARKPRQLQYQLDNQGIGVGQKHYDYDAFRCFSVITEGAFSSIVFMPLKRFAPLTTIYYAPEDEERIIDLLSLVLPYEEMKHDPVDRLMQHIRF